MPNGILVITNILKQKGNSNFLRGNNQKKSHFGMKGINKGISTEGENKKQYLRKKGNEGQVNKTYLTKTKGKSAINE